MPRSGFVLPSCRVLVPLFALAVAFLGAPPATAQWRMLSRGDVTYSQLRVVPSQPRFLYAVREGGLWRLSEADGTWRPVDVPTPTLTDDSGPEVVEYVPSDMEVVRVWLASRDPERLIVSFFGHFTILADGYEVDDTDGGMLVGSADGGATWEVYSAVPFTPELAYAPSAPDRVYATFYSLHRHPSEPFAARFEPGTPGSEPLGNLMGDFFLPPVGFAVDAADADRLYAFTTDGRVFASDDAGDHWAQRLDAGITALASHPIQPGLAVAGSSDGSVWVSENGGLDWSQRGTLPAGEVTYLDFDPVDEDRFYAVAAGVPYASDDAGATWQDLTENLPIDAVVGELVVDPGDPSRIYATLADHGVWRLERTFPTAPCTADDTTLCLGAGGRFEVRVVRQDFAYAADHGHAVSLGADDSGAFWFFAEENLELLVKVLDGRGVNGFHWVFYGSLTNVPFTFVVTDTSNGDRVGYHNPVRRFASLGDTRAFPDGEVKTLPGPGDVTPPVASTEAPSVCVPGESVLCLADGRFRAEVQWTDFSGGAGAGTAVPETDDTGFFWFFRQSNLELAVKVLDGRALTGHWWVFYGALTNVGFSLRVTDTTTGEVRTYENPSGNFASRGDTTAFAEAAPQAGP